MTETPKPSAWSLDSAIAIPKLVGSGGDVMQETGREHKMRGSAVVTAILGVLICGIFATSALAATPPTLEFDPQLSLTGGCTTSEVDSVPDPGCPEGNHPPLGSFRVPQSVVTDAYGDLYVASYGNVAANGVEGRIDIFNPAGEFLAEIPDPAGPKNLAVDSKGNLYVFQYSPGKQSRVERYEPSLYNPASGEIAYGNDPELVVDLPGFVAGLAVDRANDHLFVNEGPKVQEFSSAEEGNAPLDVIGEGLLGFPQGLGLAVDSAHGKVYVSAKRTTAPEDFFIDVFELAAPHALLKEIEGSATPSGEFTTEPTITANETSGEIFAYPEGKSVYRFAEDGTYIGSIDYEFKPVYGGEISVDNGSSSPNAGYLFVPSNPVGVGHAFAFGPRDECPPGVGSTSFANVSEGEAELRGAINPCDLATSYAFEYTSLQKYDEQGFTGAQLGGSGSIPRGGAPVPVSASLEGLMPGTTYRFRLVAENEAGVDEAEGEFTTFPPAGNSQICPNDAVRTGFSASLPDCRAYELVTPPSTNARTPRGVGLLGTFFPTREASPAGDMVSFITEGGTLPDSEGTGSLGGDPYVSTRSATGWTTSPVGPTGGESMALLPGSNSPDQGYRFWNTGSGSGSAAIGGRDTTYVRYPDGHNALVGRGTLGTDPRALGKLISENGGHIVFMTTNNHTVAVQLEPDAPPTGTETIYDRTADEVTHVVSLLPGDKTPAAGEDAFYEGASLDGRGVAFSIAGTLYLRYDDEETFAIGEGLTFAGIAEGGSRIFYLEGGSLKAFDAVSGKTIAFSAGGNVTPSNISADGSTAYFVSTSALTNRPNPLGAKAKAGAENLFVSKEGTIGFVGTVTKADVEGEDGMGLGLWVPHIASYGEVGEAASRTTPDGNVLLFESEAPLTAYNPEGHTEIYRYDSAAGELSCLSCSPTGAPASGEASLQSLLVNLQDTLPFSAFASVANLRADGNRAFFQSTEQLVATDTDGLQDVYEWEADGVGSCNRPGGCVFLISSGQSKRVDYLYAVSDSGDDVFFRSSDLLVPADREVTPSIYDARVGGGFPKEAEASCEGEGCRPNLSAPPPITGPESGVHLAPKQGKKCPRGKRRIRVHGKVRCVKRHHRHHRHHRAGAKKGASK